MMKKNTATIQNLRELRPLKALCAFAGATIILTPGALDADTEWEWEADEGYHTEEWYDPSDWFDEGNQVSYETDDDAWGYNYDTWGYDNDDWFDGFGYDYDDPYDDDTNDYVTYDDDPYVYNPYVYNPTTYAWNDSESTWTANTSNTGWNNRNQRQNTAARQESRQQDPQFEGTVDRFSQVNLKTRSGRSEKHSFVRVRLRNGNSRVISLGSNVNVRDLDLSQGDRIRASGRVARVDGRPVLIANRIQAGGKTFTIRKSNQPESTRSNSAQLQGLVSDFRRVNLGRGRNQNLLVRLDLQNGQNRVVDFGKTTALGDLKLDEGDRILVRGQRRSINGKPVLVARQVRIEGKNRQIRTSKP